MCNVPGAKSKTRREGVKKTICKKRRREKVCVGKRTQTCHVLHFLRVLRNLDGFQVLRRKLKILHFFCVCCAFLFAYFKHF